MTSSQKFFLLSKYEFPDEKLLKCGPDDLRAIIGSRLSTAQYKVDGLEGMTPVMVDYAQDLIEQARDLLLDLGETFSEEQISELSFLKWPLSKEDQQAHDAYVAKLQVDRDEAYLRLKGIRRQGLAAAKAAMSGSALDGALVDGAVRLVIGRTGHSYFDGRLVTRGPSGAQVLDLVQHLKSRGIDTAKLRTYSCSEAGVTFETDPIPNWSVEMDLPTQVDVWAFLIKWYDDHLFHECPKIEILWLDNDEAQTDYVTLHGLWPESKDCSFTDIFDALERTYPEETASSAPQAAEAPLSSVKTKGFLTGWGRFMSVASSLVREKRF